MNTIQVIGNSASKRQVNRGLSIEEKATEFSSYFYSSHSLNATTFFHKNEIRFIRRVVAFSFLIFFFLFSTDFVNF